MTTCNHNYNFLRFAHTQLVHSIIPVYREELKKAVWILVGKNSDEC